MCDLRVMYLWLCFPKTGCFVHRTLESPAGKTLVGTMQLPENPAPLLTVPTELDRLVCQAGGFRVD